MSDFVLRMCRSEDIGTVLDLWRQADATPGVTDNADDLRRAVAQSQAHVLEAEVQGRIVGSVIGTFDGWRGNIYRLAVHPDYRRQGAARALVAEVEKRLAQQGAKRITALVGSARRALASSSVTVVDISRSRWGLSRASPDPKARKRKKGQSTFLFAEKVDVPQWALLDLNQ